MKLKGCRKYLTVSFILTERRAYAHDFGIKKQANRRRKPKKKYGKKRVFQRTREWKTSFRPDNSYLIFSSVCADELIRKSCTVTRIKCELQAKKKRFSIRLSENMSTRKGTETAQGYKKDQGTGNSRAMLYASLNSQFTTKIPNECQLKIEGKSFELLWCNHTQNENENIEKKNCSNNFLSLSLSHE